MRPEYGRCESCDTVMPIDFEDDPLCPLCAPAEHDDALEELAPGFVTDERQD